MKKIKLIPDSELIQNISEPPKPTKNFLPQWYKKLPFHEDKSLIWIRPDGMVNQSMKACIPIFDAMTAGYTITLPADVVITKDNRYNGLFSWKIGAGMISKHTASQYGEMPTPSGVIKDPFKWETHWVIKTPPGYSALFTHPFYRFDLPFVTFTGIVDTDVYNLPLNLPFFLKEDFEGVIEKGTPIGQVIPIKREEWSSEILSHQEFDKFALQKLFTKIERAYKKMLWVKKIYE